MNVACTGTPARTLCVTFNKNGPKCFAWRVFDCTMGIKTFLDEELSTTVFQTKQPFRSFVDVMVTACGMSFSKCINRDHLKLYSWFIVLLLEHYAIFCFALWTLKNKSVHFNVLHYTCIKENYERLLNFELNNRLLSS